VGVVVVGVDLGKLADPTAIVVTEHVRPEPVPLSPLDVMHGVRVSEDRPETTFVVRHVERVALGTSYVAVASRVGEVLRGVEREVPHSPVWLVLDAKGVGEPVADLVREGLGDHRAEVSAATITGTDRLEGGMSSPRVKLGKAWLTARLQALAEQRLIRLPENPEARALSRELADFEAKVSASGHFGAEARAGSHDDLVIALALSVLPPEADYTDVGLAALTGMAEYLSSPSYWRAGR
jgi:hypothetical protein